MKRCGTCYMFRIYIFSLILSSPEKLIQNNLVISKLWTDRYTFKLKIIVPALFWRYFWIHVLHNWTYFECQDNLLSTEICRRGFRRVVILWQLLERQGSSFAWAIGIALNYYFHFLSARKSIMTQANQHKKCNQWTISTMADDNQNYSNKNYFEMGWIAMVNLSSSVYTQNYYLHKHQC